MSGASRVLSSTAGSTFFASAYAAALSRTADRLVAAALAGRDRVGKNRLRQWENTAAANPLQTTAEDEHHHVMRLRALRLH